VKVWLFRRLPRQHIEIIAHGNIDGEASGPFVRSFITDPDIQAECQQGWSYWRWQLRQRDGKWQVNKVNVYR
jgi:hypothetical protein